MSDKSPLFLSAMELYAHAVELYASKSHKKFKFVVLHLANAVELLLKDALIDLGESIYKNPKETVSIWTAFELLDKHQVSIPERPQIELLIDDRNTIQHRFGFPDERSTFYYLDEVGKFLRRFLSENYNTDFEDVAKDYVDAQFYPLAGLAATGAEAQVRAIQKVAPPMAVLEAYEDWRASFFTLVDLNSLKLDYHRVELSYKDILDDFSAKGYIDHAYEKWLAFKRARDSAAHGGQGGFEWDRVLGYYFAFMKAIAKAGQDGYTYRGTLVPNEADAG